MTLETDQFTGWPHPMTTPICSRAWVKCRPADQWMGKLRTKLAAQVRTLPVGWHAVGTNLLKFYHMKCIPQCSRVLVDTGKIV